MAIYGDYRVDLTHRHHRHIFIHVYVWLHHQYGDLDGTLALRGIAD